MKAFLGSKIIDPKTDRLIQEFGFCEAHSFVNAMARVLMCAFSYTNITVYDTGNTGRTVAATAANFACNAGAGTTNSGIVIGSGTNAVTMSDYNLQTQVTTNVAHGITNFFLNSPNNNTMEVIINRTFANNTGSALTINEVGLISLPGSYPFLLDRTLYTVTVPIALAITLTYKISIFL